MRASEKRAHKAVVETLKKVQKAGGLVVPYDYDFYNDNVFGRINAGRGLYSDKELIVEARGRLDTLKEDVQRKLAELMYGQYNPEEELEEEGGEHDEDLESGAANKEQMFDDLFIDVGGDGTVTIKRVKEGADGKPLLVAEPGLNTDEARKTIVAAHKLYRAFSAVMEADTAPEGTFTKEQIAERRKQLADAYDGFKKIVGKTTPLSAKKITNILGNGPMRWALTSLEVEERDKQGNVTSFKKSDIFTKSVVSRSREVKPVSVADLAVLSVATRAELDLDLMAKLAIKNLEEYKGLTQAEAKAKLRDELLERKLAFIDPEGGELVDAARYLSGNVRKKLKVAKRAARTDEQYAGGPASKGSI